MGYSIEGQKEASKWNVDASTAGQHSVKLSKGFWMAEHEVTQREWILVMGRTLRQQVMGLLDGEESFDLLPEKN